MPRAAQKSVEKGSVEKASSETRAQILRAALGLFSERGFHGASMPALAERAGVAAGTPYRHFESKEQLVNALYRQCKAELMDALLRDFAFDATPREQHRAFFHRMVGYFRARPEVFDFLELHHHQPYLDADNLARERQALAPVLAFFAHGRSAQLTRAMPAEALAAIVWGVFSGLMKAARLGHLEADDALFAQAESCAWNAVRRGDPANETPKEPEP
ncbi:MAG: TetR/AcrR family transcriptional regulator [Sandaracinaceae bacterium]|nr:MAG: TetR/AcrR family transcriptional regulator [Sandaracinaceae bacterium]